MRGHDRRQAGRGTGDARVRTADASDHHSPDDRGDDPGEERNIGGIRDPGRARGQRDAETKRKGDKEYRQSCDEVSGYVAQGERLIIGHESVGV